MNRTTVLQVLTTYAVLERSFTPPYIFSSFGLMNLSFPSTVASENKRKDSNAGAWSIGSRLCFIKSGGNGLYWTRRITSKSDLQIQPRLHSSCRQNIDGACQVLQSRIALESCIVLWGSWAAIHIPITSVRRVCTPSASYWMTPHPDFQASCATANRCTGYSKATNLVENAVILLCNTSVDFVNMAHHDIDYLFISTSALLLEPRSFNTNPKVRYGGSRKGCFQEVEAFIGPGDASPHEGKSNIWKFSILGCSFYSYYSLKERMTWVCHHVLWTFGATISVPKRRKYIFPYSRMPRGNSALTSIRELSSTVSRSLLLRNRNPL